MEFASHEVAERVLAMGKITLGRYELRLGWGKGNLTNKSQQQQQTQQPTQQTQIQKPQQIQSEATQPSYEYQVNYFFFQKKKNKKNKS